MKQFKLFLVMLLSLVGMTAAAQQPTLASSSAKPVTKSLSSGTDYLIAAGTGTDGSGTDSYYFNVNEAKVNAPLSTKQVFTYTNNGLQRKSDDRKYVNVSYSNWSYTLTSGSSSQTMTMKWSGEAASISPDITSLSTYYIISNGDDTDAAGLSTNSNKSYTWYFYKAAIVNITYYDETNSRNINTVTYVGRVGDLLTMPEISGYTITSGAETYHVTGSANVTINYTNNAGVVTEGTLKNGRYFMQNTITVNSDATKNDVWMTSYKSLVSLIPDARSFWSVWVVKCVDVSKNKYEIYNEGHRNVMTPCTDPYQEKLSRDGGYLYYDTTKKGYFVGDITDSDKQDKELTLTKLYDGTYMIRSEKAKTDYYLSFDNAKKPSTDEYGNVLEEDHCVKSINISVTAANPYWNFISVTDNDNRTLYKQGVDELDGYVGGLTTMKLPDSDVEELNAIKQVVAKYENDMSALYSDATDASVKYREFVEAINNMRSQSNTAMFCQHLVEGRPFWVETISNRNDYLNRMYLNGSNWSNSGNIAEGDSEGTFYVTSKNENITVIDPKTGVQTTYDTYYILKNGNNSYLKSPSEELYSNNYSIVDKEWSVWSKATDYKSGLKSSARAVTSTKSASEALKFVIIPIVPGIYQMCDIAAEWQGDPFLTFSGGPTLHHYRVSESFSYFKFETYNAYDYAIKRVGDGSDTYPYEYVGTYGNILNSNIEDTSITAYYIRAGKHSYESNDNNTLVKENATTEEMESYPNSWGVEWNQKDKFTVYLDVAPNNIMQGMQGYILKGNAVVNKGEAKMYKDEVKATANDLRNNNMLHVALNSIDISTDTWGNYYDYFVLAYRTDKIGTWDKKDVYGIGLAFYHVKRGSYIPTGKCYLSTADLNTQLKKRYGDAWDIRYLIPYPEPESSSAARAASDSEEENVVPGFRIVFRDSNGVQTAIEEAPIIEVEDEAALDAISTLYSLDGRKVTAPKSGEVYILNGKKVMF
ncbi:MAG: hypothetical protein ACI36Z_06195 [Alloprevotella sp.]